MAYYVTSDQHFFHKNIIDYENRPYSSVEEMNKDLITKWNSVVTDEDTVFCLGDFALSNKDNIIEIGNRLNGHKILIKGNHDHASNLTYQKAGFEKVVKETMIVKLPEWENPIRLSHHKDEINLGNYLNLYGHCHSKATDDDTHKCVCVELWNYTPILLEDLLK